MWRQKTDKRLVAAGIVAFGLVVGYGSWKDLHPPKRTISPQAFATYQLVNETSALAAVPQDNSPIAVWAGSLVTDEGDAKVTPSPIAPVVFPQREILLLYKIGDSIPRNFSPSFKALGGNVASWKKAGNLINDIYIEYPVEDPNLQALTAFCNGLRGHLEREYWIDVQLNRNAFEMTRERRTALGNLLKSVRMLVYDIDDARAGDETLAQTILRLSPEGLPFTLRVHEVPDYIPLRKALGDKAENFLGFVLDIKQVKEEQTP